MNWLIKQWFYIRYFSGFRKVFKTNNVNSFISYDLSDGQWAQDNAGWYFTKFKQKYGIFNFIAKLDGSFEKDIWPAMWLVNSEGYYFEIDIELMAGDDKLYLVYTTWVNPYRSSSDKIDGCKVVRLRFNNKYLIRRLQKEFHTFTIDWNQDRIRYYINGLLTAIIKNVPFGEMYVATGKATINSISIQK